MFRRLTRRPRWCSAAATFDGRWPRQDVVVGCVAGKVIVNAAATVPAVSCADVVAINIRIGPSSTKATNVIDLRPIVPSDFIRLTASNVSGDGGSDRVYGSFAADTVAADGNVFGLGGNDVLRGATAPGLKTVARSHGVGVPPTVTVRAA